MRTTMSVGGVLLAVTGALAVLFAVLSATASGTDSWTEWGPDDYSTKTAALVFKVGDSRDHHRFKGPYLNAADHMRLTSAATGRPGVPIFVGIGRSEDVDEYLSGVEHDFATELHLEPHFEMKVERREGSVVPSHPGDQTFWISSAQGKEDLAVDSDIEGGLRVVVMNADASPDVEMSGQIGVHVPMLFPFSILLGVGGVGFIAVGGMLVGRHFRGSSQRGEQ